MRLLQPIMPFLAEEVWQNIKNYFPMKEKALVIADFPRSDKDSIDEKVVSSMQLLQKIIVAVRNLRKQINLPPSREVTIVIKTADIKQTEMIEKYENYLHKLAKVGEMKLGTELEKPKSSIAAIVQDLEIYLSLEGLVDVQSEIIKLEKQVSLLEKESKIIESKLNNEKFLNRAPANIIAKEKEKFEEIKIKLDKTRNVLSGLK